MTRLTNLTLRNYLIALHDVAASAAAFFAAFYLRFEGAEQFSERLPLMLRILPYFLALSFVVCYLFNLTTTKWRFISLPDALNILRAATVLAVALLVLTTIRVPSWAILYLLVFGIGTVAGMMLITAAIAIPFTLSENRFARLNHGLGLVSGLVSLAFGLFIVYQMSFVNGLFTHNPIWVPH